MSIPQEEAVLFILYLSDRPPLITFDTCRRCSPSQEEHKAELVALSLPLDWLTLRCFYFYFF